MMGPPKSGRLFLKTHGDCFLHATAGWLSYASFNLTEVVTNANDVMFKISHACSTADAVNTKTECI